MEYTGTIMLLKITKNGEIRLEEIGMPNIQLLLFEGIESRIGPIRTGLSFVLSIFLDMRYHSTA
jgi:hypothetical protein